MNIIIITSSLKPFSSNIPDDTRREQTLQTISSVRKHFPKDLVILSDTSREIITESESSVFSKCDYIINFGIGSNSYAYTVHKMKSFSESYMLLETLEHIKTLNLKGINRIFKLSGRYAINSDFNIDAHNKKDKYVFKKATKTWMNPIMNGATHCFQTRFFSLDYSLIDDYISILKNNISMLQHLDTEHAHFINIKKQNLHEIDIMNVEGVLEHDLSIVKD